LSRSRVNAARTYTLLTGRTNAVIAVLGRFRTLRNVLDAGNPEVVAVPAIHAVIRARLNHQRRGELSASVGEAFAHGRNAFWRHICFECEAVLAEYAAEVAPGVLLSGCSNRFRGR